MKLFKAGISDEDFCYILCEDENKIKELLLEEVKPWFKELSNGKLKYIQVHIDFGSGRETEEEYLSGPENEWFVFTKSKFFEMIRELEGAAFEVSYYNEDYIYVCTDINAYLEYELDLLETMEKVNPQIIELEDVPDAYADQTPTWYTNLKKEDE